MGRNKLTPEFLRQHYVEEEKSTVQISKLVGCFPEQIRRALKKFGIPIRSKSNASRNFYENGGENSRKGYEFTEEEKEQASITAKEYWLSDESESARQKIAQSSKKMWDGKTKAEKQEVVRRLHQACRLASINGSKTQIKVAEILRKKYGYHVLEGVTELVGVGALEVDIALPRQSIVIEIDGITHFEHVYSDNRYERAQEADARKNSIMNGAGDSVIRVQLVCERYSVGSCLIACEALNKMIKEGNYEKRGVSYVEMT